MLSARTLRRQAVPGLVGGFVTLVAVGSFGALGTTVVGSESLTVVLVGLGLLSGGLVARVVGGADRAGGVVHGGWAGGVAGLVVNVPLALDGVLSAGYAGSLQIVLGTLFGALVFVMFGMLGGAVGDSLLERVALLEWAHSQGA